MSNNGQQQPLVPSKPQERPQETMSLAVTETIASHFIKSRWFKDATSQSQAFVKIMAGKEMGIGPFAAMQNLYVTGGHVEMRAQLMAYRISISERYRYKVKVHTDICCEIDFLERVDGQWQLQGTEKFTDKDARRQGTQNLSKYPRNMLFARALSNGARFYCPAVFVGGVNVYVPEEFGGDSFAEIAQPASSLASSSEMPIEAEIGSPVHKLMEAMAEQHLSDDWLKTSYDLSLGEITEEDAERAYCAIKARKLMTPSS